jgi:hypothetical protein
MTRYYYPDTPLLVISDSGAPVVNGIDKQFITRALTEFNALGMIPKSCEGCLDNGHATGMLEWALGFDEKLSFAYMTHARDHVIGEFFMGTTAEEFEAAVVEESQRLIDAFPGRAFRYVLPGPRHTLAMGLGEISPELQGALLGTVGGIGFGFVGPDVTSEALKSWSMGGLTESGVGEDGHTWQGNAWVRSLLDSPETTPNVLQLD